MLVFLTKIDDYDAEVRDDITKTFHSVRVWNLVEVRSNSNKQNPSQDPPIILSSSFLTVHPGPVYHSQLANPTFTILNLLFYRFLVIQFM